MKHTKNNKYTVIGVNLLILVLIVWPDFITGTETTSLIFYLVPVTISTWYSGRTAGYLISTACGILWFITDHKSSSITGMNPSALWNLAASVIFLIIYSYILSGLKKELEKQTEMAGTDYLTGIYNRLAFIEHIRAEIKRASRNKSPLTIVYMDVDNLKKK